MRTRTTTALVAATLAAVLPAAAGAFDYGGQLGVAYERVDTWSPSGDHGFVPRLRLDGDVAARGSFEPGVVDWDGRLGYQENRVDYGGGTNKGTGVFYNARLGVLQTRESRARLLLAASQSRSDFVSDVQDVHSTGSSSSQAYSVGALLAPPGTPSLRGSFGYVETSSKGFNLIENRQTSKNLELGTHVGQPSLESDISYYGQWDEGTLAPVNYTLHTAGINTTIMPGERLSGGFTASYRLREPSVLLTDNPRYEDTAIDANLGWGAAGKDDRAYGRYTYRHASITDPSLTLREMVSNTVSGNYFHRTSPEWSWVETASASYGQTRLGATQRTSAGQAAGVTGSWSRETLGASAGARVGALEPETGSAVVAYGLSANGHAAWLRPARTYSLSYFLTYDSNTDAKEGWSTTQSVYADLSHQVADFMSWSLQLTASGARGGGGAFGASAQRSLIATGVLSYRRATFSAGLGASDAATGSLSNPASDGLFIPAGYNTHSRYAVGSAALVHGPISTNAYAKFTILSGPGTPDQRQAAFGAGIAYHLGLWAFSLDDRYTLGGTTAYDRRSNELFVRASRTFGSR